jgi:hypothetical protein
MDAQAMTSLHLDQPGLLALLVLAWVPAGLLIGALHFLTLRWNVHTFVLGQRRLLAVTLQLVRAVFLAGLLVLITVRLGALPLLIITGGILAARTVAVR